MQSSKKHKPQTTFIVLHKDVFLGNSLLWVKLVSFKRDPHRQSLSRVANVENISEANDENISEANVENISISSYPAQSGPEPSESELLLRVRQQLSLKQGENKMVHDAEYRVQYRVQGTGYRAQCI